MWHGMNIIQYENIVNNGEINIMARLQDFHSIINRNITPERIESKPYYVPPAVSSNSMYARG